MKEKDPFLLVFLHAGVTFNFLIYLPGMDPEIKSLLLKSIELGEDNNRMLRSLRRAQQLAMIWRVTYLVVFLGGAVVIYNFFLPYLTQAKDTYQSLLETQDQIEESVGGFNNFFGN